MNKNNSLIEKIKEKPDQYIELIIESYLDQDLCFYKHFDLLMLFNSRDEVQFHFDENKIQEALSEPTTIEPNNFVSSVSELLDDEEEDLTELLNL